MSAALSYSYSTDSSGPYGAKPLSDFTQAAPNLYDGSVGDGTTYYDNAATGAAGSSVQIYFRALVDLGPSPPSIGGWEYNCYYSPSPAGGGGVTVLYASTDGATWYQFASFGSISAPYSSTFTPGTYRYWQIMATTSYNVPYSLGMADFRLYDAAGTIIAGPTGGGTPPPFLPNLTVATEY